MVVVRILAYLFGVFGVAGTLLPFLPYDDFWIRGFDYPRYQLVFVLALAAILWIVSNADHDWYDYLVAFILVTSMLYQGARIIPYTGLWSKQSEDARLPITEESSFSLMVANVLQTNDRYTDLINLALEQSPDLLVTLESNRVWGEALHRGLDDAYQYHVDVPLENLYGMHVFSRIPLIDPKVKYRIKDDIPSVEAIIRLGNGELIDLYFLHPMPPSPTEDYASTGRDAELAQVGMEVKDKGRTTVVAGDMNDVAWSSSSRLFQRLSGLLDPRRGRGLYATFHADYWLARWPLDHVYHSSDLALVNLKRLPHIGSDHFPVYAKFNFERAASAGNEKKMRENDRKRAKEVIEHGENGKDNVLIPEKKD